MSKIKVIYPKKFVQGASISFLVDGIIYKGTIRCNWFPGDGDWYIYLQDFANNEIFNILNLDDPKFFYDLKVALNFSDYKHGAWPEAKTIEDLYKTVKILEHFDEF